MQVCPVLQLRIIVRNDLHNLTTAYIDESRVHSEFAVKVGESTGQGVACAGLTPDSTGSRGIHACILSQFLPLDCLDQPALVCQTNAGILRELSGKDGWNAKLQSSKYLLVLAV